METSIVNLGKVKGSDGKNCYIRYNTAASDAGSQPEWTVGHDFIGFALSDSPTAPPLAIPPAQNNYHWCRFIPDAFPRLNFRGEWSSGMTVNLNDVVTHNGIPYVAIATSNGTTAPAASIVGNQGIFSLLPVDIAVAGLSAPISSGGVHAELAKKQNALPAQASNQIMIHPTAAGANPTAIPVSNFVSGDGGAHNAQNHTGSGSAMITVDGNQTATIAITGINNMQVNCLFQNGGSVLVSAAVNDVFTIVRRNTQVWYFRNGIMVRMATAISGWAGLYTFTPSSGSISWTGFRRNN